MKTFQTKKNVWDDNVYHEEANLVQQLCFPLIHGHIGGKEENIIDVGCGTGSLTNYLARHFSDVKKIVGVDSSRSRIELANRHPHGNVEFIVHDIADSGILSLGTFDTIFSFYTLQWIEDQDRALSNLYQLMNPQGALRVQLFPPLKALKILFDNINKIMALEEWRKRIPEFELPIQMETATIEEYCLLLEKHGFAVDYAEEKIHAMEVTWSEFLQSLAIWLPHLNIHVYQEKFLNTLAALILAETGQTQGNDIKTSFPFWVICANKREKFGVFNLG